MRKFNFRLESVLKLRRFNTEKIYYELMQINGICMRINDEIAQKKQECMELYFGNDNGAFDFLWARQNRLGLLEAHIHELQVRLTKNKEKQRELFQKYNKCMSRQKGVENLRKRAEERYHRYAVREENHMLSEVYASVDSVKQKKNDNERGNKNP